MKLTNSSPHVYKTSKVCTADVRTKHGEFSACILYISILSESEDKQTFKWITDYSYYL